MYMIAIKSKHGKHIKLGGHDGRMMVIVLSEVDSQVKCQGFDLEGY